MPFYDALWEVGRFRNERNPDRLSRRSGSVGGGISFDGRAGRVHSRPERVDAYDVLIVVHLLKEPSGVGQVGIRRDVISARNRNRNRRETAKTVRVTPEVPDPLEHGSRSE